MLDSCNVVIMESFYNDIVVGELNDDSESSNFRDMNKDHESYLSHWLWKKRKIFSDASTLVVLTFLFPRWRDILEERREYFRMLVR